MEIPAASTKFAKKPPMAEPMAVFFRLRRWGAPERATDSAVHTRGLIADWHRPSLIHRSNTASSRLIV